MATFLFLTMIGSKNEWDLLAFIMMVLFICTYNLTIGSTTWFYVSEVAGDIGMGFATSGQFISLIIVYFTNDKLLSSSIGASGIIFYYCIWCFIGALFCYKFVKESKGLTDAEKKSLYTPKDLMEESEQPFD